MLTLEAVATRIFHRPLQQVLTPETGVVYARLAHLRTQQAGGSYEVYCQLELVRVLRGVSPAAEIEHSFSTILESRGVRRSPIRDGSGLETDLHEGEHYFFLLDRTGRTLVRVEPESSREQIQQLLDAPSK
ncbi:MAG: hypothetical protein J0I12_17695 [Candidatus Eremiobacteraeota bacterium]|nr:hypothetical protein [Candidatus Eremiobacteraeota bacterium]